MRRSTWPAAAGSRCARARPRSATASSSTATTPRRWAASTAARRWRAWYPITPSTSLAEAFDRYCRQFRADPATGKNRYAIVQAEDELAAIGMVIGAGWNGARAFTATSGPGISLMQEFIGLAYFAEIPAVDLRRPARRPLDRHADPHAAVGPAGLRLRQPRRHQARAAVPRGPAASASSSPRTAFDLADRLQTPVFVMTDLDIGMNDWLCEPLALGRRSAATTAAR